MNYNEIRYFPDRFYAGLDGVKTKDIRSLNRDIGFKKKHAPIFHEYYHYLINLSTCAGVRQFSINFFDRFRIITRMASVLGINAFPINSNKHKLTYDDVRYWKDVCKFLKEDDIDRDLAKRFGKNFPSFKITKIERIRKDNKFKINGIKRIGTTTRIKVHISDCYERDSFYLTFGALDEFFCTAIDEYFFSQDLSTLTSEFLLNRPYYPYRCLEAFLNYYLEFRPTIIEKILITYTALNSKNPADSFISILEGIKTVGENVFRKDPEIFLRKDASLKLVSIEIVNYIKRFKNEAKSQGRSKIVEATGYFCDIFEKALLLRQTDPFYFIRPFLETNSQNHIDIDNFNKSFFDILEKFPLPIILMNKSLSDFNRKSNSLEFTCLLLATYEILESLDVERIAKRDKNFLDIYTYPDCNSDCDDYNSISFPPKNIFHSALNELGLLKLYDNMPKQQNLEGT